MVLMLNEQVYYIIDMRNTLKNPSCTLCVAFGNSHGERVQHFRIWTLDSLSLRKKQQLYNQPSSPPPPPTYLLLQLHVHPDVLQQVLQVNKCEASEVSVGFMHVHCTHVPLRAHVLRQEINWLGSSILNANLWPQPGIKVVMEWRWNKDCGGIKMVMK